MIYYNQKGEFMDAPDNDNIDNGCGHKSLSSEMVGWAINVDAAEDNDVGAFLSLYKKLSPYPIFRNKPITDSLFMKQYLGEKIATNNPLVKNIWMTGSLGLTNDKMYVNIHIILIDMTRKDFTNDVFDNLYKEVEEYLQSLTEQPPQNN